MSIGWPPQEVNCAMEFPKTLMPPELLLSKEAGEMIRASDEPFRSSPFPALPLLLQLSMMRACVLETDMPLPVVLETFSPYR